MGVEISNLRETSAALRLVGSFVSMSLTYNVFVALKKRGWPSKISVRMPGLQYGCQNLLTSSPGGGVFQENNNLYRLRPISSLNGCDLPSGSWLKYADRVVLNRAMIARTRLES